MDHHYLSSGPCRKQTGWHIQMLENHPLLHRSHRGASSLAIIERLLEKQRALLSIPADYSIALVPGSGTGSIEIALWNFLGKNPCNVHSIDVFSQLWADDIHLQMNIPHRITKCAYGTLPPLVDDKPEEDLILTYSATTTGAAYPNTDWLTKDRHGLVIVDATAAAFSFAMEIHRIDVLTYSWQKGLAGEAGHGMIVLSPKAIDFLKSYQPGWPIPKLFRLHQSADKKKLLLNENLFKGFTLNTPSALALADLDINLQLIEQKGGIQNHYKQGYENTYFLYNWVKNHPRLSPITTDQVQVKSGSVCFQVEGQTEFPYYKAIAKRLLDNHHIYDCVNHAYSVPSFRVWCGPTACPESLKAFTKLLDEYL